MRNLTDGFTLVELLAVTLIIGLVIALLLPALNVAVRSAESAACANNLRQIGLGLGFYSTQSGYLCSGAYDHKRDGDVRDVGWVADLLNNGYANPGAMLCPSSPCRFSEKWNDICDQSTQSTTHGEAELPDPPDELTLSETVAAFKAGYNTNYCTSWYLVRTALRGGDPGDPPPDPRGLGGTLGPLSLARLGSVTITTTDMIPLVGDANYGDFTDATLSYELTGCAARGQLGCESYCEGPMTLTGGRVTQDYTNFAPWHGGGRKRWANILFVDFHVAGIDDKNADTFIGLTGSDGGGDASELDRIFDGNLLQPRR